MHRERDSLHRAGGRVAVAVTAEYGRLSLGQELHGGRVESGTGAGHVPGAELLPAPAVSDPYEDDVAPADPDLLPRLGRGEVLGCHARSGFEPGDAVQPGNVEQDTASDDAVADQIDGERARSGRGQRARRRCTAVQSAVVDDVAQRIQVTVHVTVDVHGEAVPCEFQARRRRFGVRRRREPVLGRIGVVRSGAGVHRGRERHRTSRPHLADGRQHLFPGDRVQGAPGSAAAGGRGAQAAVQRPELGLAQLVGHSHTPTLRQAPDTGTPSCRGRGPPR